MNYYNENDPKAAAWLRELMRERLIPSGEIDQRSITDVSANDLSGFTQCHFFAGIGGWSYALSLAGWPEDEPVWTGSCPCQPFSLAGEKRGFRDDRHLWPDFFRLIAIRKPSIIFGEQVGGAIKKGWLDLVGGDLEAEGYAVGSAVLPACAYGADHERKRLFWVADAGSAGREGLESKQWVSKPAKSAFAVALDPFARARNAMVGDFGDLLSGDGVSLQMERDALKGYGNAIVPQVAAEFIAAFMEVACNRR